MTENTKSTVSHFRNFKTHFHEAFKILKASIFHSFSTPKVKHRFLEGLVRITGNLIITP